MTYSHPWALDVSYPNTTQYSSEILPVDDDELHWELTHALYEADVLADAGDYTARFAAVLHTKDWTINPAIGDTTRIMKPYIRIIDELFNIEDFTYTKNIQNRYYEQLAWMFLHTYSRIHLGYTEKEE